MVSDQEMGKKMVEEEDLYLFLEAYEKATGENFPEMRSSETPDFLGKSEEGQTVGIELTQLKFSPDYMFWRRSIEKQDWVSDEDAFWRILDLLAKKIQNLKMATGPHAKERFLSFSSLITRCQNSYPIALPMSQMIKVFRRFGSPTTRSSKCMVGLIFSQSSTPTSTGISQSQAKTRSLTDKNGVGMTVVGTKLKLTGAGAGDRYRCQNRHCVYVYLNRLSLSPRKSSRRAV